MKGRLGGFQRDENDRTEQRITEVNGSSEDVTVSQQAHQLYVTGTLQSLPAALRESSALH